MGIVGTTDCSAKDGVGGLRARRVDHQQTNDTDPVLHLAKPSLMVKLGSTVGDSIECSMPLSLPCVLGIVRPQHSQEIKWLGGPKKSILGPKTWNSKRLLHGRSSPTNNATTMSGSIGDIFQLVWFHVSTRIDLTFVYISPG